MTAGQEFEEALLHVLFSLARGRVTCKHRQLLSYADVLCKSFKLHYKDTKVFAKWQSVTVSWHSLLLWLSFKNELDR